MCIRAQCCLCVYKAEKCIYMVLRDIVGSCISDSTVHRRELCNSVHQGMMLELLVFFFINTEISYFQQYACAAEWPHANK